MPLEVATYVSQLDANWPLGTDKQDRGDDHLRLIKNVLKKTLAGPNGTGWEKPVTVSPDQLNAFDSRITALETGLKNVYKVGDLMIRADNINPSTIYAGTTWTRLDGEFSMYLGNGSNGGTTTGSNSPTVPVPQHNHTATLAIHYAGNHKHNVGVRVRSDFIQSGYNSWSGVNGGAAAEHHAYSSVGPTTSTDGDHIHNGTVTIANNGTAGATLDVRGARMFFNVWKRVS